MSFAMVATAVGAGLSIYGTVQQGQAARTAGNYNADMANIAANDALNRGAIEYGDVKGKTQKMIGQQRAGLAASGVDISTGTALDLQVETAGMGELDALRALNNAQREATGLKAQGELARKQGKNAARAANIQIAGSLLSAGSAAYGQHKSSMLAKHQALTTNSGGTK